MPACLRMAGCVSVRFWIEPEFVASCRLTIEHETTRLQFPGDFAVSESSKPTHLGREDDSEVPPLAGCRQRRYPLAFAPLVD
jgi:hypothetical protein